MTDSEAGARIASDLSAVGVRRGGVMLMHASLRSMGHVPGGPETVIRGLLAALGPEGTLCLPALSYRRVTREHPFFDVRETPSNVGTIAETFRTRPGTLRSVHPTHSVCACGPGAADFLAGQDLDTTPCGPHSPFRRLREAGGQLLMLGCGLRPNTSMHAVEEVAESPYLFGPEVVFHVRGYDGPERPVRHRPHGFSGWRQRYDRVGGVLGGPALRVGSVLEATVHLLDVPAMWEACLSAMKRDPFFFVERSV